LIPVPFGKPTGTRALFGWHESQHVFVQFSPDKLAPKQRPYRIKTSTSAKQREQTWDERMLICIDEAKPASLRFEVMQWRVTGDDLGITM
jgi:hypothetical protein